MAARDSTVWIFSKQNLSIMDTDKKVNMLHYDGSNPSGFRASAYTSKSQPFTDIGD